MEYSEKVYNEAKMVAFLAHKGHTYDIFPYEKHLELADRIANVEHGIRMGNEKKTKMYKEEFAEFRNELFVEGQCEKMWEYLTKLLG